VPDHASKLQKTLGDTIYAERKARNLSQEQLAAEAGISMTYLGEVERGEKMASLETITRIAAALKMTGAELLMKAAL